MKIGDFTIGSSCFIVAEIGSNHEGNFSTAKRLIEQAAECGVNAVKFQVYSAERLIIKSAPVLSHVSKSRYSTQFERFRGLQFTKGQYFELADFAVRHKLIFLCSVFDEKWVDELDSVLPAYKIASGDITNIRLIKHIAKKGKPVIMSVGMAAEDEIKNIFKYIPKKRLILLHCVSAYPAPPGQLNLLSIPFLREYFKMQTGYSDHAEGTLACLAAVALGASVLEKHFTFDKNIGHGDHRLSADFHDMKNLVENVRYIEAALGRYGKQPQPCEKEMKSLLRRSLYAARHLKKGVTIKEDMVAALRPLKGFPCEFVDKLIGRKIIRDIKEGEPVTKGDILWK